MLLSVTQVCVNNPQSVSRYTHIIIDEVHERSVDSDFLCLVVRQLAAHLPELKVILMSATLEDDRFCSYFEDTFGVQDVSPVYYVGSSHFSVDEYYLNTIKNLFGHYPEPDVAPSLGEEKQLMLAEGRRKALESVDKMASLSIPHRVPGFAERRQMDPVLSTATKELGCNIIISLANLGESVLVFLPGYAEIMAVHDELLLRLNCFKVAHFFKVFVLHSNIPLKDQEEAFIPPAPDVAHVFLATNIAESSITLPKLRLVLDYCLKRELIYDSKRHLSCLQKVWCSRSSCKQRAGRTGRVFCGVAVRMVSKEFFQRDMPEYDHPDMLKASLAKLVLQAKLMGPKIGVSSAPQFLSLALQPPSLLQLDTAMQDLHAVGAISGPNDSDEITFLGNFALSLPVDLSLCRLVMLGICFGCPVDAVVIAASMSIYQDVFLLPTRVIEKNDDVFLTSLRKSWDARYSHDKGLYSEPLMYIELFKAWLKFRNEKLKGKALYKDRQSCAKQFSRQVAVSWERLLLWESSVADIALRILKHLPTELQLHEQMLALSVVVHFGGKHPSTSQAYCSNGVDKYAEDPKCILQFCVNPDLIKLLLVASYSSNIMWGTRECNFPDVQGQKSLKRAQQVKALGVNLAHSVILPGLNHQKNQSRITSDHLKDVATFVCAGRRGSDSIVTGQGLGVITLNYTVEENPATAKMNEMTQPVHGRTVRQRSVTSTPLMNDLITLWQFGERRPVWSLRSSAEQLPRPQQPYMLTWQLLSSAGEFCRAVHSWRNPFGSLADIDNPSLDFFAVAAELQGTERPNSVNAKGLTVLPRLCDDGSPSKLPYLSILAFQSKFGSISLLRGISKDIYKALKVNGSQLNLPRGLCITSHDLVRVNHLRCALSKVMGCNNSKSIPTDLMKGIPALLQNVIQGKDFDVETLINQKEFDEQVTSGSAASTDSEDADVSNWVVVLKKHTTHQDWYEEDIVCGKEDFFPVLSVSQLPLYAEVASLPVHDMFTEIPIETFCTKTAAKCAMAEEHGALVRHSHLLGQQQANSSPFVQAESQRVVSVDHISTGCLGKEFSCTKPNPTVKLATCCKPKPNVKLAVQFHLKPSTTVHSPISEGPQETAKHVGSSVVPAHMLYRAAVTALNILSCQPGGAARLHVLQSHIDSPFTRTATLPCLQAFCRCLSSVCIVRNDSVQVERDYLMHWKADQTEVEKLCLWYKSYPGALKVEFESNEVALGTRDLATASCNKAGGHAENKIDQSITFCKERYVDTASSMSDSDMNGLNMYLQRIVLSVAKVLKNTASSATKLVTKFSVLRSLSSSPFGDKASNKCLQTFFSCLKPFFSVTMNGVSVRTSVVKLTKQQLCCLKEWYNVYPHSVKVPFVLSSSCDTAQQNTKAQGASTSLCPTDVTELPCEHVCTMPQDDVVRVLVHSAIECVRSGHKMGISNYFEHLRMSDSSPFASTVSNTALKQFFMCLSRIVPVLRKQRILVHEQQARRLNAVELANVRKWLDGHGTAVKHQSLQEAMLNSATLAVPVAKPEQLHLDCGPSAQVDEVHHMLYQLVQYCQMNGCHLSVDDLQRNLLLPFSEITSIDIQHLAVLLPRMFSHNQAKNTLILKDEDSDLTLSEKEHKDLSAWLSAHGSVPRAIVQEDCGRDSSLQHSRGYTDNAEFFLQPQSPVSVSQYRSQTRRSKKRIRRLLRTSTSGHGQ